MTDKLRAAYITNRRKEISALVADNEVLYRYHAALSHRALVLACESLGDAAGVMAVMDWEMEVMQ